MMSVYDRDNIWDYNYKDNGTLEEILQFKIIPVGGIAFEFWCNLLMSFFTQFLYKNWISPILNYPNTFMVSQTFLSDHNRK